MSRFDYCDDDGYFPPGFWNQALSLALGGKRGQAALAEMEAALNAMHRKRLIEGQLECGGEVCAIGAFVAHRRAQREGIDFATAVEDLPFIDDSLETAEVGHSEGLRWTIAWHLEFLNDETFKKATPEERHSLMLAWVRRAQGKPDEVAA